MLSNREFQIFHSFSLFSSFIFSNITLFLLATFVQQFILWIVVFALLVYVKKNYNLLPLVHPKTIFR